MAQAEYTETICIKVTEEQKKFFERQQPNPSKWLRALLDKEMFNLAKDSTAKRHNKSLEKLSEEDK